MPLSPREGADIESNGPERLSGLRSKAREDFEIAISSAPAQPRIGYEVIGVKVQAYNSPCTACTKARA